MAEAYPYSSCRRSYYRILLDTPATLIIHNAEEKSSRVMDICPRGAGAYTDYPLNSDEKVNIIIKPSALIDTLICKQARVAWCNKVSQNLWGVGFDFGEDNKITFA